MVRVAVPLPIQYKPYLCRLMAFKDDVPSYPKTIEFSQQQLLSVTPELVARWLRYVAYGTPTPGPNDYPTEARSTHIAFAKKAVSHFMPNQQAWVVEHNVGNPTKSAIVNKVIQDVKKAEVRKQGRASNAKRDMTRAEFRMTLRILQESTTGILSYDKAAKYPTMLKLQFHIIARTDDVCNVETNDIRSHSQFPFAGQLKVSWSKNVLEERECPDQILIGAFDDDFCILIALGTWLECSLSSRQQHQKKFLFEPADDDGAPDRLNKRYGRILTKNVWKKNEEFQRLVAQTGGSLGTHSVRKFPATWASRNGAQQPEIEVRGRWKGSRNGAIVNRYISVDQLPTDAKLAGILAVGGPVKYRVKADSHVTDAFLSEVVVPAIASHFSHDESNHVAQLLAPAVLYAAHVEGLKMLFVPAVRDRIISGYAAIRRDHGADYNPVEKVRLHIFRVENQVCIEELNAPDNANTGPEELIAVGQVQANRDDMQSALLQLHRLHQDMALLQQRIEVNVFTCLMPTMC